MDNFNNGVTSVAKSSFNGGNNENELNTEMASKLQKQLHTKNFMSPTISAANKASVPKRKILSERNETLDVVEQINFSSKPVKIHENDVVAKSISQPYDPIKNYLSPRPKFLRYNPNRRRKITVLQGNEESVKSSNSNESELELGVGCSDFNDSCSEKGSGKEGEDIIEKKGEIEDDDEEDEEEMVEFGEDEGSVWSFRGFLKFLFVVIGVILATDSICSMNSPVALETVDSDWCSDVDRVAGLNFSEIVRDRLIETDSLVGKSEEKVVYDDVYEELDVVEDEVYEEDEIVSEEEVEVDEILEEEEIEGSDSIEFDDFEGEIEVSDVNEINPRIVSDDEHEIGEEMEKKIDEMEISQTSDPLTGFANFDRVVAVLVAVSIFFPTLLGVVYCSKKPTKSYPSVTKSHENKLVEKEEVEVLEPTPNPSSLINEDLNMVTPLVNSESFRKIISEETSGINAPSVELLGEFEFGDEATSFTKAYKISSQADVSNSIIQATTVSFSRTKSSHVEALSTADSQTVKKQRRKNVEVTPSPVRRSSRLQSRSVMSS